MIRLPDVLAATGGQIHGRMHAEVFDSFCYDSRLVRPRELFLAVKTDRADGHAFIAHACAGGATGVLCQEPVDLAAYDVTCIVVPDTRLAIQNWARYVLSEQRVRVIGITGSVGKTTAKEAIAAVLGARYEVFRNRANYNGLYGLPIALGELGPGQQVAVLEIAADHMGEIGRLCQIAPPDVAVVTTIAPVHLETFGSLEAIAREKGEMVAALRAGGLAVLNADDARVLGMAALTGAAIVTFGADPALLMAFPDFYASGIVVSREHTQFSIDTPSGRRLVRFPLIGRHQVYAALAAFAVGLASGVGLDDIAERLEGLPHLPGRLHPFSGPHGSLLLDDSYGSSPAAVEAALEALEALEARHRIAVLGDMLELGAYESEGHRTVGARASRVLDLLVTKGSRARLVAEGAREAGMEAEQVVVTYTAEDAARAVTDRAGPGDVVLVKGSLATRMEQVTRLLMAEPEQAGERLVRQNAAWRQTITLSPDRPTWLEIDLGAIAHNVRRLKEMAGDAQIMISLKADAYGHGAVQVAQTALLNGATWLGVACLSEGVALRKAGIDAPILILGYTPAWQARDVLRSSLTPTVFDLDVAGALSRAAMALDRPARVHIKVDTGMARLGVYLAEALDFALKAAAMPGLQVEGLFTHLSVADGASDWEEAYTTGQLEAFRNLVQRLDEAGLHVPLLHAVNSAALLADAAGRQGGNAGHGLTLVRLGIAVYGLDPSPDVPCPPDFRAALAWKTQIAQVRVLPAGSYVGYGATYRTQGTETIAVIPVGYADGFRRSPQHWGEVLVRGQRAPIVGRICMDQTMVDVTHIAGVRQGDEAVLIGRQGNDSITAEEVAAKLGTINYEVVSAILARVPRETYA